MDNILLLFDRPNEPLYLPKGDEHIIIDLPNTFTFGTTDHVTDDRNDFNTENTQLIKIPEISLPDFSKARELPLHVQFTVFNPKHQEIASSLTAIFMGVRLKDLFNVAAAIRDQINSELFTYALSVALLHRQDTQNIRLPLFSEIFPDKFFGSEIINQAKREAYTSRPEARVPIDIPYNYTATDLEPEHRVAYWREDIGVNLHHWHWHLVYPFAGPIEIVKKDRRGELFYYMHRQLMARFNTERLCNGLDLTIPLDADNLDKPLPQAYFPKLNQTVAGRAWPGRPANILLSDVNRQSEGLNIKLADLKIQKNRILEAIATMKIRTADNNEVNLDEKTGIDILGNMIEASKVLSPNPSYYGDLHNSGHTAISACHDPSYRYLEPLGIMGHPTTAMRDPVFYRWHAFVDNLFTEYKNKLTPYTKEDLTFDSNFNVKIEFVSVTSEGSNTNTINTFWTKSNVDLSYGIDFVPRQTVVVSVQHLNHNKFEYKISVNNLGPDDVTGTVRIFIAPRFNRDKRNFSFEEQRLLMIELDKFTAKIKKGKSEIKRSSLESSVTIPFEATFRDQNLRPNGINEAEAFNYCGCGWPQHMLVPKGTTEGYAMDIFVMITNYEKDKIVQENPVGCRTSVSYCGLRDRKYPDARPMGFPFDRPANVSSMDAFLTPNMKIQPVTIRFTDTIKQRQM